MPYQFVSRGRFDLIHILGNLHAHLVINRVSEWKGFREKRCVVKRQAEGKPGEFTRCFWGMLFTEVCRLHEGFLADRRFFIMWPFVPDFIFLEFWGNDCGLDSGKDFGYDCNTDCSTVYVVRAEVSATALRLHIVQPG